MISQQCAESDPSTFIRSSVFSPSKSVFEIMRSTTLVELKQIVILSFLLLCDVNLVISRIRHQEELLGPLPSLELGTYNIKKSISLSV